MSPPPGRRTLGTVIAPMSGRPAAAAILQRNCQVYRVRVRCLEAKVASPGSALLRCWLLCRLFIADNRFRTSAPHNPTDWLRQVIAYTFVFLSRWMCPAEPRIIAEVTRFFLARCSAERRIIADITFSVVCWRSVEQRILTDIALLILHWRSVEQRILTDVAWRAVHSSCSPA